MTNIFKDSRRDLRERAFQTLFALEFGGEALEQAHFAYTYDKPIDEETEVDVPAFLLSLVTGVREELAQLDSQIEEKAIDLAKETIDEVRLEKERKIKKKEENFEELVKQMAEVLLKENEKYFGKDVAEKAIEKLNNTEEGGNTNEQKTKRTRRISNAK